MTVTGLRRFIEYIRCLNGRKFFLFQCTYPHLSTSVKAIVAAQNI